MKNKNLYTFSSIIKISEIFILLICSAFLGYQSHAATVNLKTSGSLSANPNPNDTVYPLQLSLTAYEYANTFNVSCFGFKDGRIDLTVNGGTPPFTYQWSEGDTIKNIKDLPSGYYKVTVIDADSSIAEADITLTQPTPLKALTTEVTISKYPNGYNVSCINCFNGSLSVVVSGGSGEYVYYWRDDSLAGLNRTGLGAGNYFIDVKDTNKCSRGEEVRENIALIEPQKDGWSMAGNEGTDPYSQFIGTLDEKDLVFKTKNIEQLRLSPASNDSTNGKIKITGDADIRDNFAIGKNLLVGGSFKMDSLAGQGFKLDSLSNKSYKLVFADEEGNVVCKKPIPNISPSPCSYDQIGPIPWLTNGNVIGVNGTSILGTCDYKPIFFKTNGEHRMLITENGNVGIGTTSVPNDYKLAVYGKILSEEVVVLLHENWPDFVFEKNYILTPLAEVEDYLIKHKHLPNVPTATEVAKNGIALGETQAMLLQKIEELTLYMIELSKKNEELQKEVNEIKKIK